MPSSSTPTASGPPPTAACGCASRGSTQWSPPPAPDAVPAVVLTRAAELHGRPVAYLVTSVGEDERVLVCARTELRLSDLLVQANDAVWFQADPLDLVFFER